MDRALAFGAKGWGFKSLLARISSSPEETLIRSIKTFYFVILSSLLIAAAIGGATWDMNFWPSDEKAFYYDAAIRLPHLKYLSQIHETVDKEKIRWLHGKEIMIFCISWMQRLMNDFDSIRPFIMVGIIAIFFSSILIYLIARRYWGTRIALFC